jgi:ATP-dependent 26S proteasome regulatory subunit
MSVGNLEEIIDENHAIVSSLVGPKYYVNVLSFVNKDQCEDYLHTFTIKICTHIKPGWKWNYYVVVV